MFGEKLVHANHEIYIFESSINLNMGDSRGNSVLIYAVLTDDSHIISLIANHLIRLVV